MDDFLECTGLYVCFLKKEQKKKKKKKKNIEHISPFRHCKGILPLGPRSSRSTGESLKSSKNGTLSIPRAYPRKII
jgi:hypothetical protein